MQENQIKKLSSNADIMPRIWKQTMSESQKIDKSNAKTWWKHTPVSTFSHVQQNFVVNVTVIWITFGNHFQLNLNKFICKNMLFFKQFNGKQTLMAFADNFGLFFYRSIIRKVYHNYAIIIKFNYSLILKLSNKIIRRKRFFFNCVISETIIVKNWSIESDS